jgi:phage terminase large subunit-like protein
MKLGCLIALTTADIRDVMVEGQSGLLAMKELADQLPCHGKIDCVRLDPAAAARSSLGPAAYSEYEQVFGSRFIGRWPCHDEMKDEG